MGLFKNRTQTVATPPPLNPITGRPYGQPERTPDHNVDDALYAAGQLALATMEPLEVRRARIAKEAAAFEAERKSREERQWYERWYRDARTGAMTGA